MTVTHARHAPTGRPCASGATLVKPKVSGAKLQTRIASALVLGGFGCFVTLQGGLVWALWMCAASYLSAKEYFTMVGRCDDRRFECSSRPHELKAPSLVQPST